MSIAYKHNTENHYMVTRISESLTLNEIGDHIGTTIRLNDSVRPWLEIADCRSVTDVSGLSGSGLRNIATMEKQGKWAVGSQSAVVVRSALHYGLARIFTAVAAKADKDLKVFYKVEDAIDWLGLEKHKQDILQAYNDLESPPD